MHTWPEILRCMLTHRRSFYCAGDQVGYQIKGCTQCGRHWVRL